MAAVAQPSDPTALPTRVWIIEQDQVKIADKLAKVDDLQGEHGELLAVHTTLLAGLREDVRDLKGAVNKGVWSLVGLCFTIAGSSAMIAHFVG